MLRRAASRINHANLALRRLWIGRDGTGERLLRLDFLGQGREHFRSVFHPSGRLRHEGTVTRTGGKSQRPGCWARSGRSGRVLPGLHRLDPEGPKRAAGDEVALKVERVVDWSVHREKALS
jgi:hypothetical protein